MQAQTLPNQPEAPGPTIPGAIHWYSILQFGLSVLAIFFLWGMALSATLIGLTQQLSPVPGIDELQLFMLSAGMAFCGVLLLPSAWYSLASIIGRPVDQSRRIFQRLRPTLLIFAFPLLVVAGYWVSQNSQIAWLLLPPIHVLSISLPILWLAYLAVRDLPIGSPQRSWGAFVSGLALAPLLILAAEVFAILLGFGIWIVGMVMRPELVESINDLTDRLSAAASSPEIMLRILQPVVSNPMVIFSVLVFAAVIVPLIEESFKPMGTWLMSGRKLVPAEGFTLGVLSGTGYALVESLFLASNGQDWAFVVFARIGTSAMHILTAGLVGWALVVAWTQPYTIGRYFRLGAIFLLAVVLHGLWNGLALTSVFADLIQTPPAGAGWFAQIGQIAPIVLGVLASLAFLSLILTNRVLKRSEAVPGTDV